MTPEVRERVARLTIAQREALRHYRLRRSAKEIARELKISHWAIHERLRSARRVLQVGSSAEAAELLASAENYNPFVYEPDGLDQEGRPVLFSTPREKGEPRSEVREAQAHYDVTGGTSWPRLPLPRYRGDRNDLTIKTRLFWIGAIAMAFVVVVGSLVSIAWGATRVIGAFLRALG